MSLTQETSGWKPSLQRPSYVSHTHLVCVSKNQQERSPIPHRIGISSKLKHIDVHQYLGFLPLLFCVISICVYEHLFES